MCQKNSASTPFLLVISTSREKRCRIIQPAVVEAVSNRRMRRVAGQDVVFVAKRSDGGDAGMKSVL
jgi:hypothetical protein